MKNQALPSFSVIVPTYRRPAQLRACLGALASVDYPDDHLEVIVVNDGNPALPESIVSSFRDQLNVTLILQPHAGPAAARNTGAAHAKGDFLAFTDDDCLPASDWLRALQARFAITPEYLIGGRTLNALPANSYSTASQLLIDYLYTYYNADPNRARFLTSNNLALSAARFRTIGGFDKTSLRAAAEDRELCDRWLHNGYRMTYAPEAVVYHAHALMFGTFWQQHFNYGRGAFYFHQVRARRGQGRIRLEPSSFYLQLFRYPSSQVHGRHALVLAVLLGVTQGANAAGFLTELFKRMKK